MIAISDKHPQPADVPEPKMVRVGRLEGEATARRYTSGLTWHVSLMPTDVPQLSPKKILVQGHGVSIDAAVQNAIERLREHIDAATELLTHLETEVRS